MSERGLILALQRYHDDPGFADMVRHDPAELDKYDLDEHERGAILDGIQRGDHQALSNLALSLGISWDADHIPGTGALPGEEYVPVHPGPQ